MSLDRMIPSGGVWAQSGPDTIPFEPLCNSEGELSTTKESFNQQQFQHCQGSRVTPYPTFVDVHKRLSCCVIDGDTFEDPMLADTVEANKRWESLNFV
jgi:hypothetical protein